MKHGTEAANARRHNPNAARWFTGADRWLTVIDQQTRGFVVNEPDDLRAAMGYLWAVSNQQDDIPMTLDPHEIAFVTGRSQGNVSHAEITALMAVRGAFGIAPDSENSPASWLNAKNRANRYLRAATISDRSCFITARIRRMDRSSSLSHAFECCGGDVSRLAVCGRDSEMWLEPRDNWSFNTEPECRMCATALRSAGLLAKETA